MNFIRVIEAQDFFGSNTRFGIIWEKVVMNYAFSVGIDGNKPNEASIFYVWNNGVKDCYSVLDTCFLDVYSKYGFSFEEKVKKEIRNFLITDLTNRYKKGLIPMENIESIGKHQVEKNLKERN